MTWKTTSPSKVPDHLLELFATEDWVKLREDASLWSRYYPGSGLQLMVFWGFDSQQWMALVSEAPSVEAMIQGPKELKRINAIIREHRAPKPRLLKDIQAEINQWGWETFGKKPDGYLGAAKHLKEEADELLADAQLYHGSMDGVFVRENIKGEIADVVMCAFQVAGNLGLDVEELLAAKLKINREREWSYDPEKGYSKHVKKGVLDGPQD